MHANLSPLYSGWLFSRRGKERTRKFTFHSFPYLLVSGRQKHGYLLLWGSRMVTETRTILCNVCFVGFRDTRDANAEPSHNAVHWTICNDKNLPIRAQNVLLYGKLSMASTLYRTFEYVKGLRAFKIAASCHGLFMELFMNETLANLRLHARKIFSVGSNTAVARTVPFDEGNLPVCRLFIQGHFRGR